MRFDLSEHFYAEPQEELAYTPVGSDDYALGGATYSADPVDSFTGRAGFAAGVNFPEDAGGAYLYASVVHEFAGDAEITGGQRRHELLRRRRHLGRIRSGREL